MADGQLGMFPGFCGVSHKNGILFGTKLMGQHLCLFIGYGKSVAVIVNETVGGLGPFQNNIGTMFGMIGEEATVDPLAGFF